MKHTLAFLFLTLSVGIAGAATITAAGSSVSNTPTNWTSTLTLPEFNPTLGTLQSIQLTLTGDVTGTVKFESLDSKSGTISSQLSAQITLERPDLSIIVVDLPSITHSDSVTAYDGANDFGGTSGKSYVGVTTSLSATSPVLTSAADLALFTGTGTLTLPISALAMTNASGSGNLITQFSTAADASVSVTYTYAPTTSSVPEPSSTVFLSLGLGLGVAGLAGRKRFARANRG